jgi:hypothetical protein
VEQNTYIEDKKLIRVWSVKIYLFYDIISKASYVLKLELLNSSCFIFSNFFNLIYYKKKNNISTLTIPLFNEMLWLSIDLRHLSIFIFYML